MKKFLISGNIVDTELEKTSVDDVSPIDISNFIDTLDDKEPMTFEITSCGGSCTAGIAICNMIKKACKDGHESTAHVVGIAASMASVIACSCNHLMIDDNAFLMIHNPWTVAEGDANKLRKEADTLDQFKTALLSIYKTKFDLPVEQISQLLEEETWILGNSTDIYNLDCEVVANDNEYKVAACLKDKKFNNIPKSLMKDMEETMEEKKEEEKITEVEETKVEETQEETSEETKEEVKEEPKEEVAEETSEEEKKEVCEEEKKEEEPEMIAKAECEKRVSGMQSTMAKKIDALNKEYNAKIEDFKNQLKAKDEELTKVNNLVTSLNAKLEDVSNELQKTASALEMKTDALAKLNAGVNSPSESVNWRDLKGQKFFDYIKAHPEVVKSNKQ